MAKSTIWEVLRDLQVILSHVMYLYSFNTDISSWTKEQATSWLSNIQRISDDDKQLLKSLELDGETLRGVTQDLLEKRGMGFGPALRVVSNIQKLLGVPSSTFAICCYKYTNTSLTLACRRQPPTNFEPKVLVRADTRQRRMQKISQGGSCCAS